MASGSFRILPSLRVEVSSRLTSQAMLESCSMVTADVAYGDGGVELFAGANAGDEVGEVGVGHGVGADQVAGGRGGAAADFELAGLLAFEVVDLVAAAIDEDCAGGAHDGGAAVAS